MAGMTAPLRLDRGTLVMQAVPACVAELFTWDARSQNHRARGQDYREIVERLRAAGLTFKDEAADFQKLDLGFAREIAPTPTRRGP